MIYSLVVNGTLSLMWGAMYYYTRTPYTLFASGIALGGAVTLGTIAVLDDRYRRNHH